jgi:hypothetical protein
MNEERIKLSSRKNKWKHRASKVIAAAKVPYMRARLDDPALDLGDFYELARKLYTYGINGDLLYIDANTLNMSPSVLQDIAYTCYTLEGFSRKMYDVAAKNHWPLKEFPTFVSKVTAEFQAGIYEEE